MFYMELNFQRWTNDGHQVYIKLSANGSADYYAVSRTPGGRKWQAWFSGHCLAISARTMAEAKAAAYQHEASLAHVVATHEDARRTEVIAETHRKLGAMVQTMTVHPLDYPAVNGRVVTQAHANYCAAHGHAAYTKDGVDQPICPRCGDALGAPNAIVYPIGTRVYIVDVDGADPAMVGQRGVVVDTRVGRMWLRMEGPFIGPLVGAFAFDDVEPVNTFDGMPTCGKDTDGQGRLCNDDPGHTGPCQY